MFMACRVNMNNQSVKGMMLHANGLTLLYAF